VYRLVDKILIIFISAPRKNLLTSRQQTQVERRDHPITLFHIKFVVISWKCQVIETEKQHKPGSGGTTAVLGKAGFGTGKRRLENALAKVF
jgi:hypothetical protein